MSKENLTVRELITKLEKFPDDMEVVISDGYKCHFYTTAEIEVTLFVEEDEDDTSVVDIGIGGCESRY